MTMKKLVKRILIVPMIVTMTAGADYERNGELIFLKEGATLTVNGYSLDEKTEQAVKTS